MPFCHNQLNQIQTLGKQALTLDAETQPSPSEKGCACRRGRNYCAHFWPMIYIPNSNFGHSQVHPFSRENTSWDFPDDPVAKNLPSNAGDMGLIPGQGTKIPHAMGQLSPCGTATEPTHSGALGPQLEGCLSTKNPECHN